MKRAWKILLVCALIIGGVFACNEIAYRNFSLRYRLTISVEDNGQIKRGTSVIETRLENPAGIFCFPFCGRILRFYGNAVTIDLGDCSVTVRWKKPSETTALQALRKAARQIQGRESPEQAA